MVMTMLTLPNLSSASCSGHLHHTTPRTQHSKKKKQLLVFSLGYWFRGD